MGRSNKEKITWRKSLPFRTMATQVFRAVTTWSAAVMRLGNFGATERACLKIGYMVSVFQFQQSDFAKRSAAVGVDKSQKALPVLKLPMFIAFEKWPANGPLLTNVWF